MKLYKIENLQTSMSGKVAGKSKTFGLGDLKKIFMQNVKKIRAHYLLRLDKLRVINSVQLDEENHEIKALTEWEHEISLTIPSFLVPQVHSTRFLRFNVDVLFERVGIIADAASDVLLQQNCKNDLYFILKLPIDFSFIAQS